MLHVKQIGPLALVTVESQDADDPLADASLLRADAVPLALSLAEQLRGQYGERLLVRNVVVAWGVTRSVILQVVYRGPSREPSRTRCGRSRPSRRRGW